ncbi:MAG: LPS export ABC transporter periplasmic protein LptC [Aquabacterium sp.]|nr:LPS export ABC transporter periplasmic protein LptC [Aquabacterium sp.]
MNRPELHLPDLPEVQVQLGLPALGDADSSEAGRAARARQPWRYRLQQTLSSYLLLLLMALLAASTWWLVRNTPMAPGVRATAPPSQTPDYTMNGFAITRFAPDGQVALRIAGDVLRHYPATDRLEIDGVRIQATAPDGRTTDATARQAVANGDGSEIQLLGGARVISQLPGGQVLEVKGEFLHAFLRFERLRSHLPVQVRHGSSEASAGGLDYDNLQQQLTLNGPVRAKVAAPGRARTPVPPAAGRSP